MRNTHEDITRMLAKWHRRMEEARMRAYLPPVPEAPAVDDSAPLPGPVVPTADDEYAWASALGREED